MELSTIKEVKPRDVWANEATDFTPWLAKETSLALLSDVVSMNLELVSREEKMDGGRADLVELAHIFEKEEQKRSEECRTKSEKSKYARTDFRLPMRVDHGMTMLGDENRGYNAGYSFLGRMFALGQVQGILAAVDKELGIEYKQPGFFD